MPYGEKKGGPQMGHSPNEMGHSPNEMSPMKNQNKGYAKQERKDLFKYDPIDNRASSIINAGARSRMGGQPQMGHSPAEMGHSPNEMSYSKSMAMKKMPMVKGPDGKMVPEFAVDGKGKS